MVVLMKDWMSEWMNAGNDDDSDDDIYLNRWRYGGYNNYPPSEMYGPVRKTHVC